MTCFFNGSLFSGDQPDSTGDKAFYNENRNVGTRGWRIVIHEKDTIPYFVKRSNIVPGMSTSIALSSKHTSRLPNPYGDCVNKILVPNTPFSETKYSCEQTCIAEAIEEKCGCISAELLHNHTENYITAI